MSASITLAPPHPWPGGTTVSLYRGPRPPSGTPSGTPVATAVVDATTLTLTFSAVPEATLFYAYANGQSIAISSPPIGVGPAVAVTGPLTSSDVDGLVAAGQTLFELDASGNVVAEWVKV